MSDLANRRSVGPVARQGVCVRTALKARLGARPGDRLVLVTLGGIAMGDDVRALPQVAGVRWLVAGPGMAGQEEVVSAAGLGYAFSDLIRACDAVITKPGYGTIVEAVCGGTRVIICARADWPETPHLDAWAQRCGVATMISRASLRSGDYGPTLAALLARPAPPPVAADGVLTAAALVADVLAG